MIAAGAVARARQLARRVRGRVRRLRDAWALRRTPNVVLGSGGLGAQSGWVETDLGSLDVTNRAHFARLWRIASRRTFLAEHVWEHLTPQDARAATENCYAFLRPGGRLRLAVPDGLHPSPSYIAAVEPGGTGAGADDHKVLFDHESMAALLTAAGFRVELLEYWDAEGEFHRAPWRSADGHIRRSALHDARNEDGELRYTSLIVDGIRPR